MRALNEEAVTRLIAPPVSGRLRLGVADHFVPRNLAPLLARFARTHPGIRLEVEVGRSHELRRGMEAGQLDLVLGKRRDGESEGQLLWSEPVIWAAAPGWEPPPGRPLPLAFDTTRLELDDAGRPARLLVPAETPDCRSGCASGLAGLVEGHLRPFVDMCHARCGIAPRVLWGNAAVILDYVAGELGCAGEPTCPAAATRLGWRGDLACGRNPLAQALCADASGCRRRRVCCLRHRLPGVPSCGALCPLERATER